MTRLPPSSLSMVVVPYLLNRSGELFGGFAGHKYTVLLQNSFIFLELPSVPIGRDIHDLGSLVPVLSDDNISQ